MTASGFREGWKPRHRHYAERIGPTGTPTKILRPKFTNFDVLFRSREESEEDIQICKPYEETAPGLHTPYSIQNLKNIFYKPLELTFGNEMYSSSVIGWTEETGRSVLINRTLLGITDEDCVPLTDTIFPVFVMGREELPVPEECFQRQFDAYEPGFYLVLMATDSVLSFTVQIDVQKGSTSDRFRVQTHTAMLELLNINVGHIRSDKYQDNSNKMFKDFGFIHRILDKDNTTYGIYGLYGGGLLPPEDPRIPKRFGRITWDQPRSTGSEDFGLNSMTAGFRYDVDYQKILSRRTGFYCSRDALLAVSEERNLQNEDRNKRRDNKKYYRTLLKDYTFVIIDGLSNYGMFHSEGSTEWRSFRTPDQPEIPVIVIVPEGVSCLRISLPPQSQQYRNSHYFNANPALSPMIINWRAFQDDFNDNPDIQQTAQSFATQLSLQPSATAPQQKHNYFKQIMNLRDFIDYVVFPINSFGRVYVFCLLEESKYMSEQKSLLDFWNIYGKLSDQTVDDMSALYYYLGSICFSYRPIRCSDGKIRLLSARYYDLNKLFPSKISTQYRITQPEEDTSKQMSKEFVKINWNKQFREIVRHLIDVDTNELNNVSSVGQSRQQTIDFYKKQSPE